jgi:hypothetical protein
MKSPVDSRLRSPRPLALIALLCAALGLVACGGGGGDGPAPAEPPVVPLGDPVTTTLGPAGGSVAFTASGVAGSLAIPAGALAADTAITVTPVAPGAEEWARVNVSGIDTVLEQPATLTLTLPAGSTLDAAAAVTQLGLDGDVLLPATVDTAARQVVVPVQRFRASARTVEQAADRKHALAALPGDPASTLILNQRLLVRLRVITAESRYQQLVRAGDYSSTLELSMSIAALLQSSGLDGYEAAALPWLQRAQTGACENLRGAMERAQSEPAPTTFDLEGRIGNAYVTRLSAPVLYWSKVANLLGGSCPGLNPSAALTSVHERLLGAIADTLVKRRDLASLKGAVGEAAAAAALKRQADTLAAVQRARQLGDDRSHALRAAAAGGRSAPLDAATNPATLGAQIRDEVMTPALVPIRAGAWQVAGDSGTSDPYRRALQLYGAGSPLADDVQQVGTTLNVGSYATASATTALGQASTGRGATPQQSATTATLDADVAGEVRLTGPIDVLKCPDAASERLVIEFEGAQVLDRPSSGDRLLQGSLTFRVPDLLRAAGVDAQNATRHSLRVKRVGSGCNATFGTADAVLSTLVLDLQPPRLGNVALAAQRGNALFELVAGGPRDELYVFSSFSGVSLSPSLVGTPMRYLARLDAQLRPRWVAEWTEAAESFFTPHSLAFGPDGHPIVLGSEYGLAAGTDAVVVASFDKDTGARRWLRRLKAASANVLPFASIFAWPGLVATADGHVVFAVQTNGRLGDKTSSDRRSMLVRLDGSGALVWGRELPDDSNLLFVGPGSNGGFAVVHFIVRQNASAQITAYDAVLHRYDGAGSASGSTKLRSLSDPALYRLGMGPPAFSADGDVLLGTCASYDTAGAPVNCELGLFDAQGAPRFRQSLPWQPLQVALDRNLRAIASGIDGGGFVAAGDTAWIGAFDANGTGLWSRSLGAVNPWALTADATVGTLLTYRQEPPNGVGALLRFRTEAGP